MVIKYVEHAGYYEATMKLPWIIHEVSMIIYETSMNHTWNIHESLYSYNGLQNLDIRYWKVVIIDLHPYIIKMITYYFPFNLGN